MDPSSQPAVLGRLLLACLPGLFAAIFAAASGSLNVIPTARRVALRDSLSGWAQKAVDRYLSTPQAIESRWLVLRVVGIASSAVLVSQVGEWSGPDVQLLMSVLVVLGVYGVATEVGTVLAQRSAEHAFPYFLVVLRPFELLAAPLAAPFVAVSLGVGQITRKREPSASLTESEVEILVNEGEAAGAIPHEQSQMIRNVLEFKDVRAGDVMVPRTQVVAVDASTAGPEVLAFVTEKEHSRYPVYRERIDNVVGILHVKDLMTFSAKSNLDGLVIEKIMRTPVVFVPESQTASSALADMRSKRHHMADVIDEFGGMIGVITLEDLLEEIVGDIRDEHDDKEPPIVDLGDGRLLVDASVSIGDLSRYLGVELPEDGQYNSLGGFMVERSGCVPQVGTTVTVEDIDFVVREADQRRVAKVEVVRLPPSPESIAPPSTSRPAA